MRHLRLVLPALAFVVAGTWTTQALACDKAKTTNASAAASHDAACSAEMAAACTPEMAAACKAKGAKGAKTAFYTAGTKRSRVSAMTASMSGSCASKATATTAVASAYDHCGSAKGTKVSAVTASASGAKSVKTSSDHCGSGSKITSFIASAGAGASCGTKSRTTASAAGSSCTGHGMANVAAKAGHGDCDACTDMALCYEELEAVNARTQMVPLKNGVMFVYTAEKAGNVNAVQSAMSRRNERLTQIVTAGDKASLCPECKTIRGAMASGKMSREVVNIEGGALTLMTSNDPAVVAKIHALVDSHKAARTKS